MDTKFNVFEVLEIAERLENKGARFYLKIADLFEGDEASDAKDIVLKLANYKAKHQKVWAKLRKRFAEKTGEFGTFDPTNYVLSNPAVMASLTWFPTKPGASKTLTGKETREEIIRDAIRRSNEVLIFYNGLKDFARDPATEETIDRIIREEHRQIDLLAEQQKK